MRRHGAHHVAQKSTRTTPFFTSSPKFASVNVLTFSDAMSPIYLYLLDADAVRGLLFGVLRAFCDAAFRGAGVCGLSRRYILTYSPAERSHEKSARIPFFCSRVQTFLLGNAAS